MGEEMTPVSKYSWHYGNYCGAGGEGPTNGTATDEACMLHDKCYGDNGFTPLSNFQEPVDLLRQCNQNLCDAVQARSASLGATISLEKQADIEILGYFGYIVSPGVNCH